MVSDSNRILTCMIQYLITKKLFKQLIYAILLCAVFEYPMTHPSKGKNVFSKRCGKKVEKLSASFQESVTLFLSRSQMRELNHFPISKMQNLLELKRYRSVHVLSTNYNRLQGETLHLVPNWNKSSESFPSLTSRRSTCSRNVASSYNSSEMAFLLTS